jgi:hypothetical protein
MLHNPDTARRKPHPYAEIFPPMGKEAFTALKSDLSRHGQKVAILLYQDLILDGRMREQACFELGMEPSYEQVEVADDAAALELVMSLNQFRRHLTLEQSAFAAARYANIKQGSEPIGERAMTDAERKARQRARCHDDISIELSSGHMASKGNTLLEAAERFKISKPSVARAKIILKHGDKDLEQQVTSGKKSLTAAAEKVAPSRPAHHAKPGPKSAQSAKPKQSRPSSRVLNLPRLRPLTPEQVDPDFKGTPLQFAQKYGHVQIMTAAEKTAADSILHCDTLFSVLRDFNARLPSETITAEGVEAWLANYSKKPVERAKRRDALMQNITAFEQTIARLGPLFTALRQTLVADEEATP